MNNINVCSVGSNQFSFAGGEVQRAFPRLSDLDKTMTSYDWDDYVAGGIDDAWGFDWCPRHRSWFDGTWDECQEWGLVCPNPTPRKRWFNRTKLLNAALKVKPSRGWFDFCPEIILALYLQYIMLILKRRMVIELQSK